MSLFEHLNQRNRPSRSYQYSRPTSAPAPKTSDPTVTAHVKRHFEEREYEGIIDLFGEGRFGRAGMYGFRGGRSSAAHLLALAFRIDAHWLQLSPLIAMPLDIPASFICVACPLVRLPENVKPRIVHTPPQTYPAFSIPRQHIKTRKPEIDIEIFVSCWGETDTSHGPLPGVGRGKRERLHTAVGVLGMSRPVGVGVPRGATPETCDSVDATERWSSALMAMEADFRRARFVRLQQRSSRRAQYNSDLNNADDDRERTQRGSQEGRVEREPQRDLYATLVCPLSNMRCPRPRRASESREDVDEAVGTPTDYEGVACLPPGGQRLMLVKTTACRGWQCNARGWK
ncbi:hypothetical protein PENSPDRAFT_663663 [Peniophora sp. CONT]|nr:hypothetical protein PENSPDRAFT_663663 [Peniophora sp. CONT]